MRQNKTLIDHSMRIFGSLFSPERPQSVPSDWMDMCQKFSELFLLCKIMIDCQKENEDSSEYHRIKYFAAAREIPFIVLSQTADFQALENVVEKIDTLPKLLFMQRVENSEWRNLHSSLLDAVGSLIDFVAKPDSSLSINDAFFEATLEDTPYVGPNIRVVMLNLYRKYLDIQKIAGRKQPPSLNPAGEPSL